MNDKKYSVTLADGTVFQNLVLNGNNFISTAPVSAESFVNNCSPVNIFDGETEEVHENMELIQVRELDNHWWFVLRDITEEELKQISLRADIEYIAMMTGVEL